MPTTIQVSERLKRRLARHKSHPRQPYEEVIEAALDYLEEDERELSEAARTALNEARKEFRAGGTKTIADVRRELGL